MTKRGAVRPDRQFDLEPRTAQFAKSIVRFAKRVPLTPVTRPLISQLMRAGTSIGANYGEANDAESKKDFRHKIAICRKESRKPSTGCPSLPRPRQKCAKKHERFGKR